jgi:hypothetical protein
VHLNNILRFLVLASKKTQHCTITKTSWLMMFMGIIPVYTDNNTKPINTKYSCADF